MIDIIWQIRLLWDISQKLAVRDVFILCCRGDLKLTQFSFASFYDARFDSSTSSLKSNRKIPLWYRAPELLLGDKILKPAVDIWSCGLVLCFDFPFSNKLFDSCVVFVQMQKQIYCCVFVIYRNCTNTLLLEVTKIQGIACIYFSRMEIHEVIISQMCRWRAVFEETSFPGKQRRWPIGDYKQSLWIT